MSEWHMLAWLTQLGLSVAVPMTCFTWLSVWLRGRYNLGIWVVLVGLLAGAVCAVLGFRTSLKEMERMERRRGKKDSSSASDHNHR